MVKYAICATCGSGLDAFGGCPQCSESGDYIDPRIPQADISEHTEDGSEKETAV